MFDDEGPPYDFPGNTAYTGSDRFLRLWQVLPLVGMSRSSWLEGVKKGIYPQPVRIGFNMVAWRESEIRAFIENPSSFMNKKDEG